MKKYLQNHRGSSLIIITIAIVVLLAFVALVTDIGMMVFRKNKLQAACDAAALAGAQELPENKVKAREVAIQYVIDNRASSEDVTIDFEEDSNKIIVSAKEKVGFSFARVLGINQGSVSVNAAAITAPLRGVYNGLRPFGVEEDAYTEGDVVVLKVGADDSDNGNFNAVALDGNGANKYEYAIKYGSENGFKIDDLIDTEPGNIVGPTEDGIDYLIELCEDKCSHEDDDDECTQDNYDTDCPRLITVPLVDTLDVNGKKKVEIVGFAKFFVIKYETNNEGKGKGHSEVTGAFIEDVGVGDIDPEAPDYKLWGVKLVD